MIDNTAAVNSTGNTAAEIKNEQTMDSNELGKEAFLELLVTQLKHQDPLNPMEDKEFVSQMAQFSSLEQMQNMNDNMSNFLQMQSLSEGSSMIGKTVEANLGDDDEKEVIMGEVTKAGYEEGDLYLYLDGTEDKKVSIKEITTVY